MPRTNVSPLIPIKDIWMIWLLDDDSKIKEFQIYDLSKDHQVFEHSKAYRTFSYIRHTLQGVSYRDWGATCSDWEKACLADIFFKYAIQYGFKDGQVIEEFLNQLSLVKEWREDILMYMGFIGMQPYFCNV